MANSRLERRQNVLKDAEAFTEAGIQHVGPSIGYWRGWRVQVPGNLRFEIRTHTQKNAKHKNYCRHSSRQFHSTEGAPGLLNQLETVYRATRFVRSYFDGESIVVSLGSWSFIPLKNAAMQALFVAKRHEQGCKMLKMSQAARHKSTKAANITQEIPALGFHESRKTVSLCRSKSIPLNEPYIALRCAMVICLSGPQVLKGPCRQHRRGLKRGCTCQNRTERWNTVAIFCNRFRSKLRDLARSATDPFQKSTSEIKLSKAKPILTIVTIINMTFEMSIYERNLQ